MKRVMLIGLVFLVSVLTVNAQQMYRWVDASGKVHYTDDPTVGVKQKAKEINRPTLPNVNSNTTISEEERAERERLAAMTSEQKTHERVQQAFKQKEKCAELAKELQALETGRSRLAKEKNSDGSYQYATEQETQEYQADKEVEYSQMCHY